MRLLNTKNVPELKEFIGDDSSFPPYAILSHTWEDEQEVTFEVLGDPLLRELKRGFRKIQKTCSLAAQDGYDWAWVDTCCIDKKASAELSEAINSMFRWYQNAAVCYVYLADLEPGTDLDTSLPKCRWFTRGWTLQELIAPRKVLFYDRDWNYRGAKDDLADSISRTTRIPMDILFHQKALCDVAVACRMSWASRRRTTRVEDMAYCLLGIFDVHMSLIYGEQHKAFSRLQELIIKTTSDLSILVWKNNDKDCPEYSGFFADSPRHFEHCSELETMLEDSIYRDPIITTRGIRLKGGLTYLYLSEAETTLHQPVMDPYCTICDVSLGLYVRQIGGNRFIRWKPQFLAQFGNDWGPDRTPAWSKSASMSFGEVTPTTASAKYMAQKLRVGTLILSTSLPTTIPFHPTDLVLGNRHSALCMSWEVEDCLPLLPVRHRAYPRSHWDVQDRLFFSPNRASYAWAATFLEFESTLQGQHHSESTRNTHMGVFVACFYWNISGIQKPMLAIASLDSIDGPTASTFEFNLDKIKFESARSVAVPLVYQTFGDSLLTDSGLSGHLSVAISDDTEVTAALRSGVDSPEVCVNPITCVDIFVRKRAGTASTLKVDLGAKRTLLPRIAKFW
ncbi:heterokaryon incompatibility protein-domain-containing protein [Immersiella caudata]|uniref:Heterokaryon incompatibility protein-domain-containing protein n=1 Tax=Immersiella caudata TaxID=314043 RepID=A0AA40CAU8_9PEZI|nr:heterokaryon incompatibility protein-domain-containing protein [Immersiella caudata]